MRAHDDACFGRVQKRGQIPSAEKTRSHLVRELKEVNGTMTKMVARFHVTMQQNENIIHA